VAGKKGAHGVKVRTEDLDALRRAGLFGVAYNTLEEGGLGLADSEVDCDPEATALEALAGKCGVCTERSYITYGALRMAGLKASSLYIEAPRAYLDEMGLPPEATHNSLIQQTKNKKILDPGLGRFDAESHYKEKSFRWVQESNREWLGFYYMLRANHYRNKNADEKLVEHYRKAQELNPNYFDISRNLAIALHNRAVDLMNDKKYPDALAKLNEARATLDSYLKKRPDDKRPLPIIKQIEETRKLLRDQFPE
jgi:tetratricopeptide (TPR) repeat protein